MNGRGRSAWIGLGALALLLQVLAACEREEGPRPTVETGLDPLAARGHHVTGGAAAGYVDDELCGRCHTDIYESYREVGMARAFYRPRPSNLIEDFDSAAFYHAPSRRHYRMIRRDGGLIMQRHQLDADGEPILEIEQRVDWILGSGNHSRTYLFRTPWGELYQLPIAWYTQTASWGMAPGFEGGDHLGLARLVRRECMFCHNAYPEVPLGSDAHNESHRFPEELPEGIGCQRCHGPGAAHSRAAMREPVDFAEVFATIVNPGELTPRLRDDVCYGCHMQPSVAIPGKRRFGRGDYSFRPGESLSEYLVALDIEDPERSREDRFEINHHPYRLEQSRCFAESAGELSCVTCHDPHRKVPAAERAAHYRAACLGCHTVDACTLEEMTGRSSAAAVEGDDCAGCHMSRRRTQDVVEVVMTDHLIRRRPGGAELLAPIAKREPQIDDVLLSDPMRAPSGPLGELYRHFAVAEFSSGRQPQAVERLERLLPVVLPPHPEPFLALAKAQLNQGRPEGALETLEGVLARFPDAPQTRELIGLAYARLGRTEEAVDQILEAVELGEDRPEARSNLGVLLTRSGRFEEALEQLERAVEMRPNLASAWHYLGRVQQQLGRLAEAESSYRRALAVDPGLERAYLALGEMLIEQNRRDEAERYWRHGAEHARRPELVAAALTRLATVPGSRAPASTRR